MALNGVPTCQSVQLIVTSNVPVHLLVRAKDGVIEMLSSTGIAERALTGLAVNSSLWARHYAPLTVASPHATNSWTGTVYMTAIFDRYISTVEFATNRELGPPNSLPVASVSVLGITEDLTSTLYP